MHLTLVIFCLNDHKRTKSFTKHSAYVKSLHSQPHLSTEGRDRKVMLALLYQITAGGGGGGGGVEGM